MAYDWISFLTDYGRRDGFDAACRGVIARINPQARVIDISHDVPPQDIRHGAAVLAQTVAYLPVAVHLAVVDPLVGTRRRPIALETPAGLLVGPDDGLLGWAADVLGGVRAAVELTAAEYRLATPAHTFDGRDVFAPAAAHLAAGVPLAALGPTLAPEDLIRLPQPRRDVRPGSIDTEVLLVDHFGNVQLAALGPDLVAGGFVPDQARVIVTDRAYDLPVVRAFGDVPTDALLVYVDAAGHVALAVNQGSAASRLRVGPGDAVRLSRR